VQDFWRWCDAQCHRPDLTPTNPLSKALVYARERVEALQVFLSDPDVAIDTNHIERALRPIPMGKKNYLFAWTELGAKHIGIIQSLIVTCRLQGLSPTVYLTDVLQRVSEHPARDVIELTPRRWKVLFADNPLRSDLDRPALRSL
jgi:transposase